MPRLAQNVFAAVAAVLVMAVTMTQVVTVPPARATVILAPAIA